MPAALFLAAAAGEPHRGWGGPIAIATAFAIIGLIHKILERRKPHSPTPPKHASVNEDDQVSEVPDTDDTSGGTAWWGQIVEVDGVRMRRARQVWKTGSSQLPDDDPDDQLADPDEEPDETMDAWVRRKVSDGTRYADVVRAGKKRWRVSERTMKRRIADARYEAAAGTET